MVINIHFRSASDGCMLGEFLLTHAHNLKSSANISGIWVTGKLNWANGSFINEGYLCIQLIPCVLNCPFCEARTS